MDEESDDDLVKRSQPAASAPAAENGTPVRGAGGVPAHVLIAAGGGAALLVGSFLPWVKLTAPFVGTITKSGTEGSDGWLTIVAGLLVLAVAYGWNTSNRAWWPALVIGALAGALVAYEYVDIGNRSSEVNSAYVAISYGVGLHLCALGAAASAVAAFVAERNETPKIDPGPRITPL